MIFIRNDHGSHNPKEAMDDRRLRRSLASAVRHARRNDSVIIARNESRAVGVFELPRNVTVEVDAIFEVAG